MSEDFPAYPPGFRAGSLLAGYRLEAQVGAGGMAAVFRARHERLDRLVALKVMAPALAQDPAFRRRFIAESRAASRVDDPHIIPVYEADEADGVLFIAMRFIAGGDLRLVLEEEGALPPDRAMEFISPVASALDAAHAAGLVHRDVKPANILVDIKPGRPDHVYLSDFGIAKAAVASVSLTEPGLRVGTPDYSAPEQLTGQAVDGRADQYALACVAYRLLTDEPPYERDSVWAVMLAHMNAAPPSLAARRPDLPSAAGEVLAKGMAKAPDDRYGSCGEFADGLRESLGLVPYRSSRPATGPARTQPPASPVPEPSAPAPAGNGPPAAQPDAPNTITIAAPLTPVPDHPVREPGDDAPDVTRTAAALSASAPPAPAVATSADAPQTRRRPRPRRTLIGASAAVIAAVGLLIAVLLTTAPGPNGTNAPPRTSATSVLLTTAPGPHGNTTTAAYNAAADNIVNASTKTGGTLNLLAAADCDSWDPQRTYYGWCWNMQRLFTRSLIGYQVVNGTKFTLAPDLATDMGTHNADYTQWTYTLKPGIKWSNGTPVTPKDIKYGIERLFATDVINGGPSSYFIQGIAHPESYAGPYKSGDLSTIVTTANTITFNLTGPDADFDYLMAMAASAPVPYKTEGGPGFTGATYTQHPLSTGPFMIQSYTPNNSIVFVRNPYWSQATDTIRHPLVNQVDLTVDTDPVDIDNKLAAGTADANASDIVQAEFQAQILSDPQLKANADDPVAPFDRYAAIIPSVIPNVDCRRAIMYAWDKAGFIRAYGGEVAGVPAGGMAPPGIPGYTAGFNPYPSGTGNTGNIAMAKQELTKCGKPNGFSVKLAYPTPVPRAAAAFAVEQAALAKVGIQVTAAPQDSSSYYSTWIGSPANLQNQGIGIAFAGWSADFPTGVGFFQSITNGNAILPTGNSNYASLNDPTVNAVLDKALAGNATEADWENLNNAIAQSATYLPILYAKDLYYRNPRMTNVTCDNALAPGIYDFVNVGVSS